jgi:hypothetical protein
MAGASNQAVAIVATIMAMTIQSSGWNSIVCVFFAGLSFLLTRPLPPVDGS